MKDIVLRLSCPAIEDKEKAFDCLVYKFLQPLDDFVHHNKVGRIMALYGKSDVESLKLLVSLFPYDSDNPFLVDYPGYGWLQFRFYQNHKLTVDVQYDPRFEPADIFREQHSYLPAEVYSKQHFGGATVNWRQACTLIVRFFQTIADGMVTPGKELLESFEQFNTSLLARHVAVEI